MKESTEKSLLTRVLSFVRANGEGDLYYVADDYDLIDMEAIYEAIDAGATISLTKNNSLSVAISGRSVVAAELKELNLDEYYITGKRKIRMTFPH